MNIELIKNLFKSTNTQAINKQLKLHIDIKNQCGVYLLKHIEFETIQNLIKYILLENCIPVERNGKWGLIDINGNELTPVQYDGFGCDADTSDSRYADVLIIPELNGIVVELDEVNGNTRTKKYGVVTSDGNLFINIVLDSIYAVTTQGETTYYATFQGQILDLVDFVRQQQASYEQNNSGSSNETSNTVNTTNTANVSQNNSEN